MKCNLTLCFNEERNYWQIVNKRDEVIHTGTLEECEEILCYTKQALRCM